MDKNRKCFTFIWKVENADYWWENAAGLRSPAFTVKEIHGTKWNLQFCCYLSDKLYLSDLCLQRQADNKRNVEIDCELACLSSDGTVLHSFEEENLEIEIGGEIVDEEFPSWNEVFSERRSVFLSQNTLTFRCRMWKSAGAGEIAKNVQCFARSRVVVEKSSHLWNIRDFSTLTSDEDQTHDFNSLETGEQLMRLKFPIFQRRILGETIGLKIIPNFKIIKTATLLLSIVDASNNATKCFQDELLIQKHYDCKEFIIFYSKTELMKKKSAYLQNDVLSLLCECCFSSGIILNEIESVNSNFLAVEKIEYDNRRINMGTALPVPEGILINDLKSMMNNCMFSDIKLKTKTKTYPAHKCILSFRSPVFKAMFSNDMREKNNDCVDIEDLNDETVLYMLQYLYSADVGELEWGRATDLYEAADKYQILNLKDICSSYLKSNLCPINACEALVLADLHHDEDLKSFIQHFILRHGEEIINSEEWEKLMETNLKLAAETMRLKFKVLVK